MLHIRSLWNYYYSNHIVQGFSNFFPSNPIFSLKILRDPKQKKMLTYQSFWEGWACWASQFINVWGYFEHSTPQVRTFMFFHFLKCWFYVYGNMFYEFWDETRSRDLHHWHLQLLIFIECASNEAIFALLCTGSLKCFNISKKNIWNILSAS